MHSTMALETPKAAGKMELGQEKWLGILPGIHTRATLWESSAGVAPQLGNVGSLLPALGTELDRGHRPEDMARGGNMSLETSSRWHNQGCPWGQGDGREDSDPHGVQQGWL